MSVLGLVLLCAAAADAQPLGEPIFPPQNAPPATGQYNEPEFVPYVNDLQLFDQPDLSAYGNGTRPPQGWFGSVEYLNWTQVNAPRTLVGQSGIVAVATPQVTSSDTGTLTTTRFADVIGTQVAILTSTSLITFTRGILYPSTFITGGDPSGVLTNSGTNLTGTVEQFSTLDTSFASSADFSSGGRFEFGRMNDDRGWLFSGFGWGSTQNLIASDVSINFENSPLGFLDNWGTDPVTGTRILSPDGYDDDIDGDHVYGRSGRDRGIATLISGVTTLYPDGSTDPGDPPNITVVGRLDGQPDPEAAVVPVGVDYDDAVPLPTQFAEISLQNRIDLYSVEATRLWQVYLGPRGGVWELFLGPRFLNIYDQFSLKAIASTGTVNNIAIGGPNTYFDTDAQNFLFGGQFGGRWSRQRGRWQLGVESRCLLAANYQHVTQQGQIGEIGTGANGLAHPVSVQVPISFSHRANQTEFSPAAEMRLNLKYQLFRSMYFQAGYTALFAQNVARGARMTHYSMPNMGILTNENNSTFFAHGLNLGLIINR